MVIKGDTRSLDYSSYGGYIRGRFGIYRGCIGVMEKKMEANN